MTPRLRSMTVDAERTILVLDRADDYEPWKGKAWEVGEALQQMAERIGISGGVVFAGSVSLESDEDDAEGRIKIYPGEVDALVRMAEKHDGDPDAALLGMLADRAAEAVGS